ncbi:MAG: NAD(P)-dependent glycerol-3-phosphate dehydrogenase [Gemmatimonadetes bacterium]|nr:NAD(P)-dependent glycerol-3-phosphate dehydrogenase [Gemmatimonadota bacterium]
MKCTVVGAGAWGTALANLLAENGHQTTLWAFEPDVSESVSAHRENRRFLPGIPLHPELRASSALDLACEGAELVLFAPPSHVLRQVAAQAARWIPESARLVVATKGIERDRLALMTDVVGEEIPGRAIVALSGPSFAIEVAQHLPTAIVAASADAAAALHTQQALSTSAFRVYTQTDVIGVELGGALKNVMAVATGIADGLQLGFNARAALITRGLAEMTRLGVKLGAEPATFAGLAGVGDLVLTCTGSLSRNRSVGIEIGRGATLSEVLQGRETVAEGVTTTESAKALAAREGIEMPIVNAVHRVLFEKQPARWALVELMTRDLKGEHE